MTTHQFNSTEINTGQRLGEVDHVVVVPNNIHDKYYNVLVEWLGERNVHKVDRDYLLNRMDDKQLMWKQTFQKLWLYNLTEYDKVIVLDADVLGEKKTFI